MRAITESNLLLARIYALPNGQRQGQLFPDPVVITGPPPTQSPAVVAEVPPSPEPSLGEVPPDSDLAALGRAQGYLLAAMLKDPELKERLLLKLAEVFVLVLPPDDLLAVTPDTDWAAKLDEWLTLVWEDRTGAVTSA